jgi:hypothetical protein
MEHWEYGTLAASFTPAFGGSIEFVTATGERQVDPDGATMPRQMKALDAIAADGWEPVGPPAVILSPDGNSLTNYLLRRLKNPQESQLRW